jgi:hypothetical protein
LDRLSLRQTERSAYDQKMVMAKPNKELKTTLDWANALLTFGLKVLPCYRVKPDGDCMCPPNSKERKRTKDGSCSSPGKHPIPKLVPRGSLDASDDLSQIKKWFAKDGDYNLAVATGKNRHGNLMVVDLDVRKGKDGPATWEALKREIGGEFPDTLWQTTGSGGRQLFWWTEEEVPMNQETKLGPGIDVKGKSGYVMVPPSMNDLGAYEWENWAPQPHVIATAPKLLEDRAHRGKAAASPAVTARAANPTPEAEQKDDPNDKLTLFQIQELLKPIPPGLRDNWLMFGGVLKTIADWISGPQNAFKVWDDWAKEGEGYGGPEDQEYQWKSFPPTTAPPIALLRKHARANGWTPSEAFQKEERRWRTEAARKMLETLPNTSSPDEIEPLLALIAPLPEHHQDPFYKAIKTKFGLNIGGLKKAVGKLKTDYLASEGETDYGLIVATRVLVSDFENGKHLIHAADGFFWKYNGRYWEQIVSEHELGQLCMTATRELGQIPKDVSVVVRQAIDNLANLQARGGDPLRLMEPPLSVINCLNGELWIKEDFTVERRDHNPDSFLRFCLNIEYDPTAKCPMFEKAVLEIFQDSPDPQDMQRHMMEVYGYAIQPSRFIKAFFIWQGGGNNGKGKLIEVLIKVAGEKAVAPGRIVDLVREYYRANLVGKLIFYEDDMEHNTVLPDGALKQYSEAKYTSGRHAYGRIDEFVVCVLPIMLCNPWPITKDLTEGTLVRAHVVPFRHKFVNGVDLDPRLFEGIIKDELAGILNRAIEGLQRLMARGHFLEPKDCATAKEEFLNASNPVPAFLNSGYCIRTVKEQIASVTGEIETAMELAKGHNKPIRDFQNEIAVATAKAEDAGIEGICQPTQEFYNNLIMWGRNEGHTWKPKKSQVERDLISLGFPVSNKSGQLKVYRVRSTSVIDQTPEPRW